MFKQKQLLRYLAKGAGNNREAEAPVPVLLHGVAFAAGRCAVTTSAQTPTRRRRNHGWLSFKHGLRVMALDASMAVAGDSIGVGAAMADDGLPIFDVLRVQLDFSIAASFVAAQVANNVLIIALSNGRILRIDLNRPQDIDGS